MPSINRKAPTLTPDSYLSLSIIIGLVTLLLFNLQCRIHSNSKRLDEKLFVQVYCDVVVKADLINPDQRGAFVDSVLSYYRISHEQFQQTVKFYSSDEEKWEKIFARIVAELERREKELKAESDSTQMRSADQ